MADDQAVLGTGLSLLLVNRADFTARISIDPTLTTLWTRSNGSFSTTYRFHAAAPRRTYAMRSRIRPEAAYPFLLDYTKSVKVRVR